METLLKQLVRGNALVFIVILGIGGTFQNGFHITVISSPSPYIQSFINQSWVARYGEPTKPETVTLIWSTMVSLYAVGGVLGSVSVKDIICKFGRKKSMIWNNIISIVAAVIMFSSRSANSFEMIMVARFLFGFAAGLGSNIHVLYLGECSPKKLRGMVTLTSATFVSIGKLSGQLAGLREILGREELWNVLLCVPACFSVIQLIALPFFPEAPRYLLIDQGNEAMCKKALQTLWGKGDFKMEIEEMVAEQAAIKGQQTQSLVELLRDRRVRLQLLAMLVINVCIQFCGISAISAFSFNIFQEAGIPLDKIRYVTLGVGASEVMTSFTCGLLIERVGRRALLWRGFGAMSVTMALITLLLHLKGSSFWIPYSMVGLIFLFVIFYVGGPAGVMPSLTHEIFIQSSRPAAFVFTGILRWLGFAVMGLAFPFLIALLKSLSFVLFSCVCLTAGLFIFFLVPETKGKTLLEISEEFNKIQICRHSLTKDMIVETRF
ncbi:solute carrier family 2 member 9, like 1 [Megalops cyprinoides]|uniref:solute carrier family 2 member 9, like 1 n=1 Tax=Megalops cyprinoides TaxID=118141 RepID=UPI001863D1CF|nr:solute carrier family 2 member 9, like 1 [Megalops cyprinoides]